MTSRLKHGIINSQAVKKSISENTSWWDFRKRPIVITYEKLSQTLSSELQSHTSNFCFTITLIYHLFDGNFGLKLCFAFENWRVVRVEKLQNLEVWVIKNQYGIDLFSLNIVDPKKLLIMLLIQSLHNKHFYNRNVFSDQCQIWLNFNHPSYGDGLLILIINFELIGLWGSRVLRKNRIGLNLNCLKRIGPDW